MTNWVLKALGYYLALILVTLAVLTIIVEKVWTPIRNYRRRRNEGFIQDATQHDINRLSTLDVRQQVYNERAQEKEQKRRQRELERQQWIVEEQRRRLGYSEGHRLGAMEEESILEAESKSSSIRKREDPLSEARRIREEQDREFNESLRVDQQKEQQIRQRKEAAVAKEKNKKEKTSKLEAMAAQPPRDVSDKVCCIGVRLPNGERVERRFYADTTLEAVLLFAEISSDLESHSFQLVTPYPKRVLSDTSQTLEQAGLMPKAVLIVDPLD